MDVSLAARHLCKATVWVLQYTRFISDAFSHFYFRFEYNSGARNSKLGISWGNLVIPRRETHTHTHT